MGEEMAQRSRGVREGGVDDDILAARLGVHGDVGAERGVPVGVKICVYATTVGAEGGAGAVDEGGVDGAAGCGDGGAVVAGWDFAEGGGVDGDGTGGGLHVQGCGGGSFVGGWLEGEGNGYTAGGGV